MRSTIENDSGTYINGVYTSKNGYSDNGLVCPKGIRLYDPNIHDAIFYQPDDTSFGEHFEVITREAAPDILPYYAISNYGRVLNIKTGRIMKPNYRPNGYEYICMAADNCKNGQKKYSTHRIVLKTFHPVENMDSLQVNHINNNKKENYVDMIMPDGSIKSNLEWNTAQENTKHRSEIKENVGQKLSTDDAKNIRLLHDQGYTYEQIRSMRYERVSVAAIQNVCLNKSFYDQSYNPVDKYNFYKLNPGNAHRLSDADASNVRSLHQRGYTATQIREYFYSDFSLSSILDIINHVSHNRE